MKPEDLEDIKRAFASALEESRGIDAESHAAHHRFIENELTELKRRRDRRDKVKQQIYGWGIISFLTACGYGAYELFVTFVKRVN